MNQDLKILPAGAGSGKTWRIKTDLADWVEQGLVRPDRILAVTFTEAAAGELRDRIRFELMTAGKVEGPAGSRITGRPDSNNAPVVTQLWIGSVASGSGRISVTSA